MNNERREFLNLRNLPARLEVEEAGWYLGFAIAGPSAEERGEIFCQRDTGRVAE